MNGPSRTSHGPQHTKRIHNAWKSRIHNLIQSPLPWRKINRQETNEFSQLESLETLLSKKRGRTAFRDFLKSEFCDENLDFWLACQELKNFNSPKKLTQERAARIYEEFIGDESPRQVNLDFYTRDIISQGLRLPGPSCFNAAEKKIYSLMENDSFPRFIQSEQYKDLLEIASKQRGFTKYWKALKMKCTRDLIQCDSQPISLLNKD